MVLIRIWYFLLFILVIGLIFYDNVWWLYRRESIEGTERESQIFGKIMNISQDHFYIRTNSLNLRIESSGMPPLRKAKYGETVVHVRYLPNGVIKGINYHNYDYSYYTLYIFSFIALIIFLIIFFKEWKLTLRGFKDARLD